MLQKLLRDQPSLDRSVHTESVAFRRLWHRQRWFCGFCGHFWLPRGRGDHRGFKTLFTVLESRWWSHTVGTRGGKK